MSRPTGKVHRLFVGNLPPNIQDQELKNEFASYGPVKNVELKHKRNPADEITNTFAFINIEIDGQTLKQCLQEFKEEKYKGRFLNVTVARENFLDKLKREREEAAAATPNSQKCSDEKIPEKPKPSQEQLNLIQPLNSNKSDDDEDDSSSGEEDEKDNSFVANKKPLSTKIEQQNIEYDDLIMRKKSKAFLQNGKIRIDAGSVANGGKSVPIHIIERNKNKKGSSSLVTGDHLDDKAKVADKKRLESLGKMTENLNLKKLAIKQALSQVDNQTSNKSNKIIFNDDDGGNSNSKTTLAAQKQSPVNTKTKGKSLFEDADDEDVPGNNYEKDFQIKEQFQGEQGAQLFKLQSRFKNDSRFQMDSKFWEGDNVNKHADRNDIDPSPNIDSKTNEIEETERNWQYGILESVVGRRLHNESIPNSGEHKSKIPPTMLRYDPTIQDHTKYLAEPGASGKRKQKQQPPNETNVEHKKPKLMEEKDIETEEKDNNEMPVSQDQFYKVNTNLLTALRQPESSEFSLLNMFGTTTTEQKTNNKLNQRENLLKQQQLQQKSVPYNFDLSDDEPEENPHFPIASTKPIINESNPGKNNTKNTNKGKNTKNVWHEKFFMGDISDKRWEEGLQFFLPTTTDVAEDIDDMQMDNKRKEMRNFIKKKIKSSIKDALPHGAKPNRHFRKFVRNL